MFKFLIVSVQKSVREYRKYIVLLSWEATSLLHLVHEWQCSGVYWLMELLLSRVRDCGSVMCFYICLRMQCNMWSYFWLVRSWSDWCKMGL